MKSKRKISKSQASPQVMAMAKQLKASGFLSKQANLHQGRYVSRGVLKKVRALEWAAINNYRAVPVSKVVLEEAKAMNLQTIGRKVIVPKDNRSKARIEKGIVTGLRPIPGGQMQIVKLPYGSMTEFLRALKSGEVDKFKSPTESFGFVYFGSASQRNGMMTAFPNAKSLYNFLVKYDSITNPFTGALLSDADKAYAGFVLYRLHRGARVPPEFEAAREAKKARRQSTQDRQDRRSKKNNMKRVSEISARQLMERQEYDRERKKREWQELKENDAAKYRAIVEAAAERSRRSRARRKKK